MGEMVLLLLIYLPSVNLILPPSPPSPSLSDTSSTYHSLPPTPSPSPAPAQPSPPLPARPKHSRCPRDEWLPEQWIFQIATNSLGSQPLLWSPQTMIPAILMVPWTSSKQVQPLHLSPHPSDSLSNALMQICGRRLVRERWRLTDSMALGRLSSCPLGSVQLAPDGS